MIINYLSANDLENTKLKRENLWTFAPILNGEVDIDIKTNRTSYNNLEQL